ncbi:hypothetical protein BFJ69_g1730 [Fusarium oxysporum]|uniref:Metallo-beta-lactamase domain-containing protein n=1 Tax=Fusarium oxysporum TaxID=5507 RepID=A0A420NXL2_FUSOX|nr:hypothetical protein BFJ69_g1730 [Fusarium oxysporum]
MAFEIQPERAPALELPRSSQTVRVKAIDTTTNMNCKSDCFVWPPIKGHDELRFTTLCFLIEHQDGSSTKRVLFDLGARKDYWNAAPIAAAMIKSQVPELVIEKGVDEILEESGLPLSMIDAVVWSHWHWDHMGNLSLFPTTVDLVVGPGFTQKMTPGYPDDPNGLVLSKDLSGRKLREPLFDSTIASYKAHDYFGDGSFYLLDVPGHTTGHICGFARTTPDTFVLLGGDCCHFTGAFRPTRYAPMPSVLSDCHLDSLRAQQSLPCTVFTKHHPAVTRTGSGPVGKYNARRTPFYEISDQRTSAYSDPCLAQKSIDKMQVLDAHPNILICLAHDPKLMSLFKLFNEDSKADINDWKERRIKERALWDFLNEFPRDSKEDAL